VNSKNSHNSGDNENPANSKVTKKRKTDDGSVPTAMAENETKSNEESGSNPTKGKTKPERRSHMPFERIKADKVVFADERLKDNTFRNRVCPTKRHSGFMYAHVSRRELERTTTGRRPPPI
jgi:hypothetical protein